MGFTHRLDQHLRRFLIGICLSVLPLSVWLSCSIRSMTVTAGISLIQHGMEALADEPDFELAKAAAFANIKTLEALHRQSLKHEEILVLLAQSFGSAALAFVEDPVEELFAQGKDKEFAAARKRAESFYLRGLAYAEQALLLHHPGFRQALTASDTAWRTYLAQEVGREDVPRLFWFAFNFAGALNMRPTEPASLADTTRLEVMAERLAELDEHYFFSGPRLLLAVKHASLPPTLGGSFPRAQQEFDRVFELTRGKLLLAKVLWVRYYAVGARDREAFRTELQKVLDAPLDILPERRLLTVVAKRRAGQLLRAQRRLVGKPL